MACLIITSCQDVELNSAKDAETAFPNPDRAFIPNAENVTGNTCNCEYQILEIVEEGGVFGSPGFLDYQLGGGNSVHGKCPPSLDCDLFSAYPSNTCFFGNNPCRDLITTVPTGFISMNCDVPAYSDITVDWGPIWRSLDCTSSEPLLRGHIKVRLRCQDQEASSTCLGYGYYSDEMTLTYEFVVNGSYPDGIFELGGDCGCTPSVVTVRD